MMKKNSSYRILYGCFCCVLFFRAIAVSAQDASEESAASATTSPLENQRGVFIERNETPRGLATGLGLMATALGTSALEYNPAGLTRARAYHVQATGGFAPKAGVYTGGISLSDSITAAVSAGFSLRALFGNSSKAGAYSGWDSRLGIAIPISPQVSLGLSGRYISLSTKTNPSQRVAKGFTGDAALQVNIGEVVKISAVGQNLINRKSVLTPVMVGGSVNVQLMSSLTLGGDILFDLTTDKKVRPLVGGGIEYFTGQAPLRAGYIYDDVRRAHFITGGLGYINDKIGIEASVRQEISGPGPSDTWVLAGLTYFVQ